MHVASYMLHGKIVHKLVLSVGLYYETAYDVLYLIFVLLRRMQVTMSILLSYVRVFWRPTLVLFNAYLRMKCRKADM